MNASRLVGQVRRGVAPIVYLTRKNLERLPVRQWGIPTGAYVGKVWRSGNGNRWTLTALLPHPTKPGELVSICTFDVVIVGLDGSQSIPVEILDAIDEYRNVPGADVAVLRFGDALRIAS